MSEEYYPILFSAASSLLVKLDKCNLEEFGTNSDEVERLKASLTQLPSIISSSDRFSRSRIYESVFGLHELLNKQVHPSLEPSWRTLTHPLVKRAKTKGLGGYAESSKGEGKTEGERNLLTSVSFVLPKSDDFKADQVPPFLVPCVAYCALYPNNHRIIRETLVNQWMAEGFLGLPGGYYMEMERELEEIGDRNFMELLSMGVFVEPIYRFGDTQQALTVHSCKVHPTVHQLARDFIGHEASIVNPNGGGIKESAFYVAVHQGENMSSDTITSSNPERSKQKASTALKRIKLILDEAELWWNTRTCIFFVPQIRDCSFINNNIGKTSLSDAKILDLAGTEFEELPKNFERIRELRYLSISRNTKLKRIDKIGWERLKQLQTLAFDGCVELEKFNLEHATLLRHLYYTSIEPTLEIHTSTLRILQISQCLNLRLLSLSNHANFEALRRLRISECPRLVSLPDTRDLLPRVEELVIHNCARLDLSDSRWLYTLPRLKHMELIGLPKMTELPAALQHARALRYLMVADCMSLRSMDQVLQHLHFLHKLCVYDCPALSMAPNVFQSLSALQSLDIRECQKVTATSEDQLRPFISHIPVIIFDGRHLLTRNDDLSQENVTALGRVGPQMPSLVASTDFYLPRNFPYFLLNMEKNNNSPEGILDEKYKAKTPYRWAILALALRVIVQMRVRQDQRLVFCRLFPSNFEFEKDKLIQLWMARGLIREPAEHLDKRFDHLLAKGYILDSRTDKLTGISWYKINAEMDPTPLDWVKSKDRYALVDGEDTEIATTSTSLHHVSIASNNIDEAVFNTLEKLGELETVLFIRDYGHFLKQLPPTFFKSLPLMHTLDLSGSHISELPSSVERMTQLCFLDLSFTLIKRIPESISLLKHLQTLRLIGCKHLHKLPQGMKELVNLYHLEFDVLGQLTSMPKGLGSLNKLRTLSAFIVSKEKGCGITELKDMNNLGGSLCISGLEYADDFDDINWFEGILKSKMHLTRLHLKWNGSICYQSEDKSRASSALERLRPPVCLVELQISYYPGLSFPDFLSSNFAELTSITLLKCEIEELDDLGRLPNLKHLAIFDLNRVTHIKTENAYNKLEILAIDGMRRLEKVTRDTFRDCPPLTLIKIRHCPDLLGVPFLSRLNSLKYLEISYCTKYKALPLRPFPDSLQTLVINHCPNLKTRCSQGGGDWEKIQHVENILIDMKNIRSPPEDDTDTVSEEEDDDYNDSD